MRRNFIHEVGVEMRKVAWPTQVEVRHNAAICFGVLGSSIGAIAGLDVGISSLIRLATVGG